MVVGERGGDGGDIWIVLDPAGLPAPQVDAALGKQEGLPVLVLDFQGQVFTQINSDQMLPCICVSIAVSHTGYKTYT